MDSWKKQRRRPTLDEYFMNIAHHVARRSTCYRRNVGAVIVKDKRLLATGYNGVPAGITHCIYRGCIRMGNPNIELYSVKSPEEIREFFSIYREVPSGQYHELCIGVHAEQNAIIQAAFFGISIKGADIYTTTFPCIICTKMIINAGIERVVYDAEYIDPMSVEMLEESGIKVEKFQHRRKDFRQMKIENFP